MNSATINTKIHPHKMAMWLAIGSMMMMFSAWISAVLVRKGQGNWKYIQVPSAFWISTVVIILSSITLYIAVKNFKERQFTTYKILLNTTTILGVLFLLLQVFGFKQMLQEGIILDDKGNGVSGSFFYVIVGAHGIHMLAGVIALLSAFLVTNFRKNKRIYSSNGLEIVATFWHFVDVLWLILFIFFIINQK